MTARRIVLSPLGLKETDLRLLKTICALSEGRDRAYSFLCSQEPLPLPTLWVVDSEEEARWRERHGARGAVAVIIAPAESTGSADSDHGHVVRRPVTASRLLAALDAVAEKEMVNLSQMVIGGAAALPITDTAGMNLGRVSGHTALVVDDSPTIRKQIELSLRARGVAAVCAESASAAMKALQAGTFDVIFLDVVLPGEVDGYQICKTIKRDAEHKRTPVVMLTSKSSTFDRVRGSLVGCDTYLTKPVDTETFNRVLEKYLPHAEGDVPRAQLT